MMGARLLVEVSKFLTDGPTLEPAERLVLLAVADRASEKKHGRWNARQCYWSAEALAGYVGVSPRSLSRIYRQLAAVGLEVRVPIGVDRRGHLRFTQPGRATTFELPDLAAYSGEWCAPTRTECRAPERTESEEWCAPERGMVRESSKNGARPRALQPVRALFSGCGRVVWLLAPDLRR
ncbi:hypothetical protein, partial [Luteimicrobium xylanilyticum]|uniref:hypothetical protein n=1 Tax=Luteimicrobium xylanilyticum TaxID=1133546 RepID=UPI0031E8ECF1